MNKIISSLFFFLLVLGCKKDSEAPILELSETTIKMSSLAENHSFSIVSNRAWKVISSENGWITISPASGNNNGKVAIACNANQSSKERSLVLTVSSEELEKSINLIQDGASPEIILNKSSENVDASQNSIALIITTNEASWTTSGVPEWITLNPTSGNSSGNVNISILPNTMASTRSATITFTSGSSSKMLTITQAAATATLNIDKTSENVNSAAGSFAVEVTINGANWTTSGVPNWITLSPANGSSSGNLTLTYQSNTQASSRNATITFTSGSSSKTLTINQAAATATLNIDKSSENVNSAAGSFAVEVTTNGASWTTSGVPNWITLSPANSTTSDQVTISYQSNTLAVSRNATITFTSGTSSKSLTVTQAAATATLNIDKTSENVNSAAGSFAVEVTTNGASWTTSGVPNWITLSPANGSTSGQVTISYQSNTLASSRNATITFTSGSSSKSLTVTQAAASPILQLSLSKKQVSYQAGSVQIELTTNDAVWKINSLPDWISANPLQGDKSGTITLDYQVNTLKEKRSAQIVFSSGNVSQTLLIEQLTSIDANDGGNW